MRMTFDTSLPSYNRFKYMTFWLASYSMEGEFLGMQKLKSQINVCPTDYSDERTMFKFGTVYQDSCSFYIEELVSDVQAPPSETNIFYELFLQDGENELVDVPVLITNYRNEEGRNTNTGSTVRNSW